MTMSTSHSGFVHDCWRCLSLVEKRWKAWEVPPSTDLEGALVVSLAFSRLADHRNFYLEHDDINAGVACIFHGATRMCEVSPDEWAQFTMRAHFDAKKAQV